MGGGPVRDLTDAEVSGLLDSAAVGVEVDSSVKSETRSATLALYRAIASGDAGDVDPPSMNSAGQFDLIRITDDRPDRSRWRFATVAAVLLLVVAGTAGWIAYSSRRPPTAPSTSTLPSPVVETSTVPSTVSSTPATSTFEIEESDDGSAAEALGDQFMSARADYDWETLVDLLDPDATFGDSELAQSVVEYRLQSEWERIVDWQFLDPSCTAGTTQRVVCSYSVQDAFNEAAGQGPFPGNSFLFVIEDGKIASVSHILTVDEEFFRANEVQFYSWVRANHPDDLNRMLDGDRLMGGAIRTFVKLTDESMRLWDDHVSEYLATADSAD
jgi:hypothetical protein